MDASSSSSSSSDSVKSGDDDLAFDQRASRPIELAVKLHLWDMSFDLKSLHKEAEEIANHGRGHQQLVLAACKSWAPSAPSVSKAVARFSYECSQLFPDLKYLPTLFGHYIYISILARKPEEDRVLDHVLRTYLVLNKDKCGHRHTGIFTFGGIAIRSE